MKKEWTLEEYLGWISTWSAIQRYKARHHYDPVPEFQKKLAAVWNNGSKKTVSWKIVLKVGKW